MIKVPKEFKTYFWDIDFDKLEASKHPKFVIKRVLDHGDTDAIRWLQRNFDDKDIINVVMTSRDISRISANFWADYYNLNKSNVVCLQKPYTPIRFGLYN